MATERLERILAQLSGDVGEGSAARLCEASATLVGVSGAGIMLMSGDVPAGSLATTNEVSALIEELQYAMGEGPCVDAYHQDRVVHEADLADSAVGRWLAFTPPALAAGVRAVFGFPLRVGADTLADQLEFSADFHYIVQNAAGMVAVQLGVPVSEALIRIRAFAFSAARPLGDVARDIVERTLRFERPE